MTSSVNPVISFTHNNGNYKVELKKLELDKITDFDTAVKGSTLDGTTVTFSPKIDAAFTTDKPKYTLQQLTNCIARVELDEKTIDIDSLVANLGLTEDGAHNQLKSFFTRAVKAELEELVPPPPPVEETPEAKAARELQEKQDLATKIKREALELEAKQLEEAEAKKKADAAKAEKPFWASWGAAIVAGVGVIAGLLGIGFSGESKGGSIVAALGGIGVGGALVGFFPDMLGWLFGGNSLEGKKKTETAPVT